MRWTALAIALYGCGCSAPDTVGYEPEPIPSQPQSPSPVIVEEEAPTGLCFTIPSDVESLIPTLRSESHVAAAAWGFEFSADGCANRFVVLDELFNPESSASVGPDDSGALVFKFRRGSLRRLAPTAEDCSTYVGDDGFDRRQTPLLQVLLHEFGHALGYRGDDPEDPAHSLDGIMKARLQPGCSVLWPTSTDRSSLVSSVDWEAAAACSSSRAY